MFSVSHRHVKGVSSKLIALKVDVIEPENILFCRRLRASFIPEIVEAGAVKGLNGNIDGKLSSSVRQGIASLVVSTLFPICVIDSWLILHRETRNCICCMYFGLCLRETRNCMLYLL